MSEEKLPEEAVKALAEIFKAMYKRGMTCGRRIAEIARQLHPNAVLIHPLYRSAVVILPEQEEDEFKIIFYGDPHADGKEITPETVAEMKREITLTGGRYFPSTIYLDKTELEPKYSWDTMPIHLICIDEMMPETAKENLDHFKLYVAFMAGTIIPLAKSRDHMREFLERLKDAKDRDQVARAFLDFARRSGMPDDLEGFFKYRLSPSEGEAK